MNNPVLNFTSWLTRHLPDWFRRSIYRLGPISHVIRRFLNLFAPKGQQIVTVAAGRLAGMQMILNLQSEKDYWLGTYEPELQATIKKGKKSSEASAFYEFMLSKKAKKILNDFGYIVQ